MNLLFSLYMALVGFVLLLIALTYRRHGRYSLQPPRNPRDLRLAGGEHMRYPSSITMSFSKKNGWEMIKQSDEEKEKKKREYDDAMTNFQRAILSIDEMDAAVEFTQKLINKEL